MLDQLIDAAESLGIEIAIFKGLAIGSQWYPRPDLRPAVDIDIFIDPARCRPSWRVRRVSDWAPGESEGDRSDDRGGPCLRVSR